MRFTITERMMREGKSCNAVDCPGVASMAAAGVEHPRVSYDTVSGGIEGRMFEAPTPKELRQWMAVFDDEVGHDEMMARETLADFEWEIDDRVFECLVECHSCNVWSRRWFRVSLITLRLCRATETQEIPCPWCEAPIALPVVGVDFRAPMPKREEVASVH